MVKLIVTDKVELLKLKPRSFSVLLWCKSSISSQMWVRKEKKKDPIAVKDVNQDLRTSFDNRRGQCELVLTLLLRQKINETLLMLIIRLQVTYIVYSKAHSSYETLRDKYVFALTQPIFKYTLSVV